MDNQTSLEEIDKITNELSIMLDRELVTMGWVDTKNRYHPSNDYENLNPRNLVQVIDKETHKPLVGAPQDWIDKSMNDCFYYGLSRDDMYIRLIAYRDGIAYAKQNFGKVDFQ